jgi:hypothetical protein
MALTEEQSLRQAIAREEANLAALEQKRQKNAARSWIGWQPSPMTKSDWFLQPGAILEKGLMMHDWTHCF